MPDFWKKHSLCSLLPFVWVLKSNPTTKLAEEKGEIAAAKTKIHFSAQKRLWQALKDQGVGIYSGSHIEASQTGWKLFFKLTGCRSRACNRRLLLRPGTRNPVDSHEISYECAFLLVPSQHTVHSTDPGIVKHTLHQLTHLRLYIQLQTLYGLPILSR